MSSSLCPGLQSCLEPRLVEPHILMHELTPPPLHEKPILYQNQKQKENSDNNHEKQNKGEHLGGWSFIQAITIASQNSKQGTETEEVYVHPLVKRSSSILSMRSLEMCTESLGSETGSNISQNNDEFSSMLLEKHNIHGLQRSKSREFTRKINRNVNFPPPLTSIGGSDGVQVRPHRKGDRLVLKAVTVSSSSSSCFQAERANGRLRLSFLMGSDPNCDIQLADGSEENVCTEDSEGECHDNDADADDDGEDVANDGSWEEGKRGNDRNVACEIEVGDFPRPSRCKEGGTGNKEMPNWDKFLVPIS